MVTSGAVDVPALRRALQSVLDVLRADKSQG
jgi:hypothetical protein